MNRILLAAEELPPGHVVTLRDQRAEHLRSVLHVVPGQVVKLGVLDGPRGTGVVEAIQGDNVILRVELEGTIPPAPRVDLLLALPRPKVLKRLWAQVAALGVHNVVITNAAKVERNYFDTHWLRPEVYGPLLVEGLQQAGDTRLPRVTVARVFRPLIEDRIGELCPASVCLVADPAGATRLSRVRIPDGERVLLAVGPEGGWNAFELSLLGRAGFLAVNVGTRTLRTDTACVALIAILHELMT
ncbi:MAG: RsmE family RNA methyltransferase [Myxococcota bacterium]